MKKNSNKLTLQELILVLKQIHTSFQAIADITDRKIQQFTLHFGNNNCLQCFDAVGWAAGRASGLYKTVVRCWCGCLSGARCSLAYGPGDATATHCLLLQIGFTFLVPAHLVVPEKDVKRVCVRQQQHCLPSSPYCIYQDKMTLHSSMLNFQKQVKQKLHDLPNKYVQEKHSTKAKHGTEHNLPADEE